MWTVKKLTNFLFTKNKKVATTYGFEHLYRGLTQRDWAPTEPTQYEAHNLPWRYNFSLLLLLLHYFFLLFLILEKKWGLKSGRGLGCVSPHCCTCNIAWLGYSFLSQQLKQEDVTSSFQTNRKLALFIYFSLFYFLPNNALVLYFFIFYFLSFFYVVLSVFNHKNMISFYTMKFIVFWVFLWVCFLLLLHFHFFSPISVEYYFYWFAFINSLDRFIYQFI